ncbi:MAG: class I SAM-dependent methyltransferase [Caulobacteraceae bacterium]|nr:class I SAM-dependent methyltransferase [Caulobacteraceae bacterium]
MKKSGVLVLIAALTAGVCVPVGAEVPSAVPAYVAAAVANPARPAEDVARDEARKPAAVLTFAGVKPGWRVLELIPGKGYFTRLLSGVVGPQGHVAEAVPQVAAADVRQVSNGVAADPHFANVGEIAMTPEAIGQAGPVDMVWTSQNYHDLHLSKFHQDVVALDRTIYAALRPGGIFFIEDHAAAAGTGLQSVDALHRIDEAFVKQEIESVGFRLVGESEALRNRSDPHTLKVFDPSIRGHTDQFLLKFQKPGRAR